jgi:alpha-1,2-mannosyltransferase
MTAAALSDRERWLVVGGGLLATFAAIGIGMPSDNSADAALAYPPHAWLLMLPFGHMSYGPAAAIWSALNLFCIYRAAELIHPRRDLALFAALSPAALMMLTSGYAGGFLALLAAVIVVQGHERPIRAGLCLALMTVQPQFALLLALMLLLLGYRRAVLIAIPWTLALVVASVITFGVQPCADFLHAAAVQPTGALSLYAGARMAGMPGWVAQGLQWSFSFAVLTGAALVFLRRGPEPRSIALLLLAVVLALPTATGDSLVKAIPALTLALFAARSDDERPLLPLILALLIWLGPVLAVLFGIVAWPVAPVVVAVIVLAALARETAWKQGSQDAMAYPIKARRERTP